MNRDDLVVSADSESGCIEACHRKLWRAVILQTLYDANGHDHMMLGLAQSAIPREISRARAWLVADSADLRLVCELADLEAGKLLAWARRKYGRH